LAISIYTAHIAPVDLEEARRKVREWRWLVVIVTGLTLVAAKRVIDWREPLFPNVVLYIGAVLALAYVLRFDRREIGLALPEDRRGWAIVGVLLAGAVVLALAGTLFPSMMEYYPVEHWGPVEPTLGSLLLYEGAIAVIMLAVELLYRGWLVLGASERLGGWAVLVSAVPYALAHLGKPPEEVAFSLFAGIVFGLADLEARSILPSFSAHFLGSALFDMLALGG
jgi:membrane protease YdiL (CAAX protease family)